MVGILLIALLLLLIRGVQSAPISKPDRPKRQSLDSVVGAEGIRLNKCLESLSRRAADDAIMNGRVHVNNKLVLTPGVRINPKDKVMLDGKLQTNYNFFENKKKSIPSVVLEERDFIYIKYWKPKGVTCTSDKKDSTNIIQHGGFNLFPQRLFTVGRLDKDSTGLILLTSDGRVNNAMLSPLVKKEKVYVVDVHVTPTDAQIKQLAEGVVITTISQRDSGDKEITAKTRPCIVKRVGNDSSKRLEFILVEGRNRQIRKSCEVVGLKVINLHRTMFAGIGLRGLASNNWQELDEREMQVITNSLQNCVGNTKSPNNEEFDE